MGTLYFLIFLNVVFMFVPDVVVLVSYICVIVNTIAADLIRMSSYVPSAQFQELNSCE